MVDDLLQNIVGMEGVKYLMGQMTPDQSPPASQPIPRDAFGGQVQSFAEPTQSPIGTGVAAAVGQQPQQAGQVAQAAASAPPVQGANLLDQAQKFLSHPLIQGALTGIGAGLGSPHHTSPREKFGRGLATGMEQFGQQTNVQAAEADRQQALRQQAAQQQQTAQYQQQRIQQTQEQTKQNAAIHGLQSPEENAAWIESTKSAGDPNLIKAQQIAGNPSSPTFKADALKIWQEMNQNDQKDAKLQQLISHQQAMEQQRQFYESQVIALRQQGKELDAKKLELEGVKIQAMIDKGKAEVDKMLQADSNKKVDQYRQFSADYMSKNQVDLMTPEGQQRFEEYKRNIAQNVVRLPMDPETGKPWDQKPAASAGKELSAMPAAAENKDRIIRDTKTGKRYKSDGKNWVPQP